MSPRVARTGLPLAAFALLLACPSGSGGPGPGGDLPACEAEDESLTCGAGACAQEVLICEDGFRIAESCDEIDLGEHGEQTCGEGVCEVTVSVCRRGQPMACTPGTPTHPREICGTGLDEDCDGRVDCEDLDCYEPRQVVDFEIETARGFLNTDGRFGVVVATARQGYASDLMMAFLDELGDPMGEPVRVFEGSQEGGLLADADVVSLETSNLVFAGDLVGQAVRLLEVGFDGEVLRDVTLEAPEGHGSFFRDARVAAVSDDAFLVAATSSGVHFVLVNAEGQLLSEWQAMGPGIHDVVGNAGHGAVIRSASTPFGERDPDLPGYARRLYYQRLGSDDQVLVTDRALEPGFGAVMWEDGTLLVATQAYDVESGLARAWLKVFDADDDLVQTVALSEDLGRFDNMALAPADEGYWVAYAYTDETGLPQGFHYQYVDPALEVVSERKRIGASGHGIRTLLPDQEAPRIVFQRMNPHLEGSYLHFRNMSICPDGFQPHE